MGKPAQLRRMNAGTIVDWLARQGPASRAVLARATGLSAVTAGKVVDDLMKQGILEETNSAPLAAGREMGRPGTRVQLSRGPKRLVAVQLGVRHTRLAGMPVAGPQDTEWDIEFPTPDDAGTWLKKLRQAYSRLKINRPLAIVASVPGVVDEAAGRVLLCPNLRWLERVDLPTMVADACCSKSPHGPVKVHLVQEIRALALGQLTAEPSGGDFLLVDCGEGMGGAMVTGGRLMGSPLPLSGELGHTPVLENPRKCGCGAVGCIETLAARPGLLKSFVEAHPGRKAAWPVFTQWVAAHGVEPWLDKTLQQLGVVVVGALNTVGVRRVIVTGALAELGPQVLETLRQTVCRSAMWGRFAAVDCVTAPRRRALGLAAAAVDRLVPTE